MEHIRLRVGFENYFVVNALGKRGGLALLWNDDLNLVIFSYFSSHITSFIWDINSGAMWSLTGFYDQPETCKRFES